MSEIPRLKIPKAPPEILVTYEMENGIIYCGDNLSYMVDFPSESIDLVYLDPPFFSGRDYKVVYGVCGETRTFTDTWKEGIDAYLYWLKERIIQLHRILKPTGTIFLHCDRHASHYIKVMMDTIFGPDNFLDEIIWQYHTSSGAPKKWLHRNHDTIFRYAARNASLVTWNHPRVPWPESTLKKLQRDEHGNIYRYRSDTNKRYYINPEGKLDDDVWDITFTGRSNERVGYPTQKPIELLNKIVQSSSNRGDVVLDPFIGSGTTLVAAKELERKWIGIDSSFDAVQLAKKRVEQV